MLAYINGNAHAGYDQISPIYKKDIRSPTIYV